jgi:23S rRNA pseudouridine2604 synthase
MRINKFLSDSGICSRRRADKLIKEGKVKINSSRARLGDQVKEKDKVFLNGKLINNSPKKIYIAFHKPYGVITTTSAASENKVTDYINIPQRVFPIGRLDVHSSGLLLLTNDGSIVNKLLKSSGRKEKEYNVTVNKPLTEKAIKKLAEGIIILGQKTRPATVKKINSRQFSITIIEGKNRQIRRMCEKTGYNIKILKRIRFGNIRLGSLARGKWRHLTKQEIKSLCE